MGTSNEFGSIPESCRRYLLALARSVIDAELNGVDDLPPCPEDPVLQEERGAFVTLKKDGALRGCIGHVIGVMPLWRAVEENAAAAAFRDPRFPPLESHELGDVHLEISVLTPLLRCGPEGIQVGRDGVLVERGPSRGLLLPQVATDYGWDRTTFLDHCCRKAGMERGCWRDPSTRISRFSAEVFSEPTR